MSIFFEDLKVRYVGGKTMYQFRKDWLKRHQKTFFDEACGDSRVLIFDGNTQLYRMTKKSDRNKIIPSVCKAVIGEARKYVNEFGKINSPSDKGTYKYFDESVKAFLLEGNREIHNVDIVACYWNMLKNKGIISSKVFDKYLSPKTPRLIAVGNLAKRATGVQYIKGRQVYDAEIRYSDHEWVWNYVVSESWRIMENINKAIGGRLLMFKTDCFNVRESDVEIVVKALEKEGLNHRVDIDKIIGVNGSFLVVENEKLKRRSIQTGSSFKIFNELELPEITKEEIETHNQNIEQENAK